MVEGTRGEGEREVAEGLTERNRWIQNLRRKSAQILHRYGVFDLVACVIRRNHVMKKLLQ